MTPWVQRLNDCPKGPWPFAATDNSDLMEPPHQAGWWVISPALVSFPYSFQYKSPMGVSSAPSGFLTWATWSISTAFSFRHRSSASKFVHFLFTEKSGNGFSCVSSHMYVVMPASAEHIRDCKMISVQWRKWSQKISVCFRLGGPVSGPYISRWYRSPSQ